MIPSEPILFQGNKSQWKNNFSEVKSFFQWWVLCTPTHNNVLQKKILIKESFHRKFFRSTSFNYYHHFFVPHWSFITNFSKVFQREMFSVKRKFCKKESFFLSSEHCTPTHKIVKIFFYKNTYQTKTLFSKICFFIFNRMYLHWWILQYQSNLFSKSNFRWKKHFLQIIIFPLYRRPSVPSLRILSFQKTFHGNSFQKKYFSWILNFY